MHTTADAHWLAGAGNAGYVLGDLARLEIGADRPVIGRDTERVVSQERLRDANRDAVASLVAAALAFAAVALGVLLLPAVEVGIYSAPALADPLYASYIVVLMALPVVAVSIAVFACSRCARLRHEQAAQWRSLWPR